MLRLRCNQAGNAAHGDRGGFEHAIGDDVFDLKFFLVQRAGALAGGPFREGGLAGDADHGPAGDLARFQNLGGEAADLAVGAGEVGLELDRCSGGGLFEECIARLGRGIGRGDGGGRLGK